VRSFLPVSCRKSYQQSRSEFRQLGGNDSAIASRGNGLSLRSEMPCIATSLPLQSLLPSSLSCAVVNGGHSCFAEPVLNVQVANTSVVIIAEAHNPTILHPSFLRAEGIVPTDWQLAAEPPISTPAISVIRFANQISFVVDPNKFQVIETNSADGSLIADLANRYVKKLPHVHYSAVGININAYAECPNPEDWMLKRFIKESAWTNAKLGLKTAAVRLTYQAPNAQLNLNVDVGTTQSTETAEHPCIVVNANYHTPIEGQESDEKTVQAVSLYNERITHFRNLMSTVLNE
jgi:hypothetical protein